MKRLLLLSVIGFSLCTAANAENKINLYSDAAQTSCELVDNGFALRTVYVFLTGPDRVRSVRFRALKPACWNGATWVGDTVPDQNNLSTGNSQQSWTVFFFGPIDCPAPPLFVGNINFVANGLASTCCELVASAPTPDTMVFIRCDYGEGPLSAGQRLIINPDNSCRCQNPLAVESSTWGHVKSLYR
jgi:hypothetical protein